MVANDSAANNANSAYKAVVENKGHITFGNGMTKSTAVTAINKGLLINSGSITINSEESNGLLILDSSTGQYTGGNININGKKSLGIYNEGTLTMSGGTIVTAGDSSIGVYSNNTTATNLSGGNIISKNGGTALYSGDNSIINISGAALKGETGGLVFYNYNDGANIKGKYNIASSSNATVEEGGILLYTEISNISDLTAKVTNIKNAFTNAANLNVTMNSGSIGMLVDTPGITANISQLSSLPSLTSGFFNFSGSDYYEYVMKEFDLVLDNTADSNLDNGIYSKLKFINSNIAVENGVTVAGTKDKQLGAAQRNSEGAVSASSRYVINNGVIELSGKDSTGLAGDFVTVTNSATGTIKLSGQGSAGIYTANGSVSKNDGLIELGGDKNIGIFGQNYFDGTASSSILGYGDDSVRIVNNKDIKTKAGGVTGDVFGIYADNNNASSVSQVTLGSSSVIDLKGTGNVIGLYLNNTKLDSDGAINISSQTGGSSVGLYGNGLKAGSSLKGNIEVSGGNGAGVYLKDSTAESLYNITVDNVTTGIGVYAEGTSAVTNKGTVLLGSNTTGAYASGSTTALTNSGTIKALSGAEKVTGFYVGSNSTGTNTGIIDLTDSGKDNLAGVYNSGIFNMSSGNISVSSVNGAGIYSAPGTTANLSGGVVTAGSGTTGLYADNSTINLSGGYKTIVNGGIFALNKNGSGNLNMAGNASTVIDNGGLGFYVTGDYTTYLSNFVTGSGMLEIELKDSASKLMVVDSPLSAISLNTVKNTFTAGSNLTSNIKISGSSSNTYTALSVQKGKLLTDTAVNLDDITDIYNRTEFINSSIDISSSMSGTQNMQMASGQENYGTGSTAADRARIVINNTGSITLSGNSSTGLFTNFGEINNSGTVSVTGDNSAGLYGTNGSQVVNSGIINVGNRTTGIYAANYLNGTPETYGDGKIDIENSGTIKSSGTVHGGYGIYTNNTKTISDSKIKLTSTSNIDVSGGEKGVGLYGTNTTVDIDGNITVGKNGVGVYLSNSTGNINGGTINLNGDNSVGYYLTNGTTLTNNGGSLFVDGKNVILMITDSGSNIVFNSPFNINAASGSTYTMGNLLGGTFYNDNTVTLASDGSLINGNNTLVLFGNNSDVVSTGTNVIGMSINGQYTGVLPAVISGTSVSEEGTNLGVINLGDSSAGMYLTGGARGRNKNIINVGNQSLGIYSEGSGGYIVNDGGTVKVLDGSVGMLLNNGDQILNNGNIDVSGKNSAGIYVENTTAGISDVINNNNINVTGDVSTGIYTAGAVKTDNTGSITAGNSESVQKPSLGIYQDNAGSTFTNSGTVNAGNNSIGVYNVAGKIQNSGVISAGDGGIGIYSESGNLILDSGSSLTVGSLGAIGVYAVNQNGTVQNNSEITTGDDSYGLVFTGNTVPVFINDAKGRIGNNSMYVFSSAELNAENNDDIIMTGSGNVGYYLKNGGTFKNTAVITGNTGTSNIGVYGNGADLINDGNIIMGDSELYDYTESDGTLSKAGYSVGMYGKNSNVTNNSTIEVGKEGIGIYVSGNGKTAENYGTITGTGENTRGIYADNYSTVKNYGIINLTGDGSVGILGRGGAQIYNEAGSIINITGNNVYGIYLSGADTKLVNNGTINITGTGLGIAYTSTADNSNITDTTGTTQGMISQTYTLPEMPTLVNTGEINIDVNNNFNYDGFKVIVTIDPATNTATTNSTTQVGFGGILPGSFEVAPDFATGTAADRYTFVNIFRGLTGKGEYVSQSLTWDATAQGNDLVMTRKSYEIFTDGLWYEDFGRALNEKYAVTLGDGREIFDKINYITNEADFRNIISSLAGDLYSNMNQREQDIADTFEGSLRMLQDSKNNTKENVKINVIAGKGKNKEETDGVVGYDYETTGVLALREVERTYRHTFGYSLGYLHTGFEFNDSRKNEETADTIQAGLHNKYKADSWVLRNDLTGRASIHDMERSINWVSPYGSSDITGKYESYSITSDNTLGKEISLGKRMTLTPYGGIKAMYMTRPTFTEKGLESLQVEGNDAWSVKPKVGAELKGTLPLGDADKWKLKGSLNVLYEYELADLNVREEARLTAIEDDYHRLAKPEDENGQLKTQVLAGVEIEDRFGIFVTGEYKIAGDGKNDYRAGVNLKAAF